MLQLTNLCIILLLLLLLLLLLVSLLLLLLSLLNVNDVNIQYDQFRNTKQVLNAIQNDNEDRIHQNSIRTFITTILYMSKERWRGRVLLSENVEPHPSLKIPIYAIAFEV